MTKIFQAIIATLLVSFSATALAQCIGMNAPGPPRHWDGARGCYVPMGTPELPQRQQGGYSYPSVQYGGYGNGSYPVPVQRYQQQVVPMQQGYASGQPGMVVVNGRQVPCTWQETTGNVVSGAIVGNAVAYMVNRFTHKNTIDRTGASVAGGLVGYSRTCVPDQQVMQYQQAQPVQQYQQPVSHQYQPQSQTVPGKCDFGGGVIVYTYEGIDGCQKVADRMSISSRSRQQQTDTNQNQTGEGGTSCGIKLAGVVVKDFPTKEERACGEYKTAFIEKFNSQCRGKGGSDAADIECAKKI